MQVDLADHIDEKEWDACVAATLGANFYQTSIFAHALKELHSARPLFVTVKEGEKVIACLLACRDGFGQQFFEERPAVGFLSPLVRKAMPHLHWAYGPLFLERALRKEALEEIVAALSAYCLSKKVFLAEGLPALHGDAFDAADSSVFTAEGFSIKKHATFLIDLTQGKEILWSNLDKAARKAVTDCNASGVVVSKASSEEDVKDYLALLKSFRKKMGFLMPPFYPAVSFWAEYGGKNVDVYLAKQDGKLISGMGVVYFGGVVSEVAVARDLDCKAYAQDAIKWAIIRWGAENGQTCYDLGGVSPAPVTPKEKGLYQFKAKWGGKLVPYEEYSKFFSRGRKFFVAALKKMALKVGTNA
ncbi:peptidoglycan bridge formation glycyltransferase FemA/FemB family protein [Candidatus Micrarchaeota archaeon]|nr:peptidoglycan bridge formation glycyltransferase FemA/FemB family protein [Candidatus Micrarchaeota archaeon]